jgi:hypothetical protein
MVQVVIRAMQKPKQRADKGNIRPFFLFLMKIDIWPTAHRKKSTKNIEVIGSSIDFTGTPPKIAESGGNGGPGGFELI